MSTPIVGLTHDVVIYGVGNAAVGLTIESHTYQVKQITPLVPRMAMGAAKGADYSTFTSWIQDTWEGRSGLENADGRGFRNVTGFIPVSPSYSLSGICNPSVVCINTLYTTGGCTLLYPEYTSPAGVPAQAVYNLGNPRSYPLPGDSGYRPQDSFPSRTRIYAGTVVLTPEVKATRDAGTFAFKANFSLGRIHGSADQTAPALYAYDAVQYSTIAAISPYIYTATPYTFGTWGVRQVVTTLMPIIFHDTSWVAAYTDHLYQPVGATTAGALGVYDRKLWRSEPKGDKIAYYRPAEATTGYWSDWVSVSPGTVVIKMREFIGRLMIGCYDGLYAYEAGRTYKVVDFTQDVSILNFSVMESILGALWFNIQQRVFRYTSGGLLEEMDVNFGEYEFPLSLESGPNCIYILAGSRIDSKYSVYRIDSATGSTSKIYTLPDNIMYYKRYCDILPTLFVPDPTPLHHREIAEVTRNPFGLAPVLTEIDFIPASGEDPDALWGYMSGLDFGVQPPTVVPGKVSFSGSYSSGKITHGYPAINKYYHRARLTAVLPVDSSVLLSFRYRTRILDPTAGYDNMHPAGDEWATLTPVPMTNDNLISLRQHHIVAKWIEASPLVYAQFGSSATGRVSITGLELDATLSGPRTDDGKLAQEHRFTTTIVDNKELLDGTVENSAVWITAAMYSITGSAIPYVVGLPHPPPTGHTTWALVEFDARGAMIPVLGYAGVSCAGSHVGIIIREV